MHVTWAVSACGVAQLKSYLRQSDIQWQHSTFIQSWENKSIHLYTDSVTLLCAVMGIYFKPSVQAVDYFSEYYWLLIERTCRSIHASRSKTSVPRVTKRSLQLRVCTVIRQWMSLKIVTRPCQHSWEKNIYHSFLISHSSAENLVVSGPFWTFFTRLCQDCYYR